MLVQLGFRGEGGQGLCICMYMNLNRSAWLFHLYPAAAGISNLYLYAQYTMAESFVVHSADILYTKVTLLDPKVKVLYATLIYNTERICSYQ